MPENDAPNLLYIHSDQHTPFVLGCCGDPIVRTPNIDQLASNGALFDATYCNSPICVPSRMSMLTGLHPHQNHVWTNEHILDSSIPTLAHALGSVGYHPVLIGRLHSVGPDQLRGYAERYVGDHHSNYAAGIRSDRGILEGTAGPHRISLELSGSGQSAYQVHDEYVTVATVDYLNRLGVQKRAGLLEKPFCITTGFMLPHAPFVAHRKDFELYYDTLPLPTITEPFSEELHPHLYWWRQHTKIESVTEDEIRRARAAYWGLVTRIDAMIGEIINALHANDLADNTLIIYTSDHGDMVGEHSLWWKHVFYEHSVRVPLIMAWPDRISAGQRISNVVSALDINATILDALDAPPLPESPGRSLIPLVMGTNSQWENVAFSEYCSDQFCPTGGCYQRMIRRDEWKLIYYHEQEPQLFNLKDDPDELVNLAGEPGHRLILEELLQQVLQEWNPETIKAEMALRRKQESIRTAWLGNTNPRDQYRWEMRSEMNYLD